MITDPHTYTWHPVFDQELSLQTFDPPDKLREKISVLCDLIRSSQHMIVHTGAGVSTAAGTAGYAMYLVPSPGPRAPATYYLYMYIMYPAPYINNYFVWEM